MCAGHYINTINQCKVWFIFSILFHCSSPNKFHIPVLKVWTESRTCLLLFMWDVKLFPFYFWHNVIQWRGLNGGCHRRKKAFWEDEGKKRKQKNTFSPTVFTVHQIWSSHVSNFCEDLRSNWQVWQFCSFKPLTVIKVKLSISFHRWHYESNAFFWLVFVPLCARTWIQSNKENMNDEDKVKYSTFLFPQ